MTLMAGATLQHGKYTIQTVLEQNEWGITYQALQVDLAQIVVVQTLNLPASPASDLDQFLATVRQRLSPLPNPQVSVLECFIESNLLFIVLKHAEGGLDLDLRNWLSPVVNFLSPAPAQLAFSSSKLFIPCTSTHFARIHSQSFRIKRIKREQRPSAARNRACQQSRFWQPPDRPIRRSIYLSN